ncbi:hypothetical protein PGTUg99_005841 [Puccinia graminis f. sp. tritici]|uniref:Uncharacterized protein n=1 Tax=Puccinia graminis f. sp. tritici TaxID=56615 RepID=A0A5B0SAP6_PUCGR|nr:hypothetical protein PGTUg99_005841 [Puccinia graminis f. sp. tritici]
MPIIRPSQQDPHLPSQQPHSHSTIKPNHSTRSSTNSFDRPRRKAVSHSTSIPPVFNHPHFKLSSFIQPHQFHPNQFKT